MTGEGGGENAAGQDNASGDSAIEQCCPHMRYNAVRTCATMLSAHALQCCPHMRYTHVTPREEVFGPRSPWQ